MRNSRIRNRRGTTAVEVAICLPVLFLVLFGSYELAHANMLRHATESAAYEGARVGIVPGATKEKIEDAVAFVMRSVGATNFQVKVTPSNITPETKKVLVEVALDIKANTNITQFIVKKGYSFRGKCALTREVL